MERKYSSKFPQNVAWVNCTWLPSISRYSDSAQWGWNIKVWLEFRLQIYNISSIESSRVFRRRDRRDDAAAVLWDAVDVITHRWVFGCFPTELWRSYNPQPCSLDPVTYKHPEMIPRPQIDAFSWVVFPVCGCRDVTPSTHRTVWSCSHLFCLHCIWKCCGEYLYNI